MKLLVCLFMGWPAGASLIERCTSWFVRDDPYQYEEFSDDALARAIAKLEIRKLWGVLTVKDGVHLAFMLQTRERRRPLPNGETD